MNSLLHVLIVWVFDCPTVNTQMLRHTDLIETHYFCFQVYQCLFNLGCLQCFNNI